MPPYMMLAVLAGSLKLHSQSWIIVGNIRHSFKRSQATYQYDWDLKLHLNFFGFMISAANILDKNEHTWFFLFPHCCNGKTSCHILST